MKWYFQIIVLIIFFAKLVTSAEFKEEEYEDDFDYDQFKIVDQSQPNIESKSNYKVPAYDLSKAPELFQKFITDYNKNYKDNEDYNRHYQQFVKNLEEINKLNANGDGSASFDINMFADLNEEELKVYTG